MKAHLRKLLCCKIKAATPPSNGRSSIRSMRGRSVMGHRPRFPAILHALFWLFFMIMHYFLLALLVHIIRHPSELRDNSSYMMVLCLDIFSVYFMIFNRREMFGILEDSCATLHDVSPEKLKKINRYFKYFLVAYLLYSTVVIIMQLVSNEHVRGFSVDQDGYISYSTNYLLFSETLEVAPAVELASMCIYIVFEALTFFVVGGFLVLLWSYMFSVVVGLGQNLIDYVEELRFSKVEAFNDRFLTVVALIQRLNRLLKNLLVLWFVVTLYSSCFGVTWYIMDNNKTDKMALNFKLPYMFQEILDLAVLTIAASRIPHSMDKAYRSILFLSKEALATDKVREYQFMKGQLGSGGFGIKLGGMFLITRKLFLSFLGVGVTYMVVSIQLNPVLFKKLQKDIEKSLEPNATEPT